MDEAVALPRPTFVFALEDGSVKFEWIDDNVRVTLFVESKPGGGMEIIKTTSETQDSEDDPPKVIQKLTEWLTG